MKKDVRVFDYRKVKVKHSMVSLYIDAYRYFGWVLVYSDESLTSDSNVELEFQRDRKIRNKAELTRLQRNFDACVEEICQLEKAKSNIPSKTACGVGFIGSIFMCCSALLVFAYELSLGILMAIPGFLGWISPKFLHSTLVKKKSEELDPLIEQKYEEIHQVCQKANSLLDSTE